MSTFNKNASNLPSASSSTTVTQCTICTTGPCVCVKDVTTGVADVKISPEKVTRLDTKRTVIEETKPKVERDVRMETVPVQQKILEQTPVLKEHLESVTVLKPEVVEKTVMKPHTEQVEVMRPTPEVRTKMVPETKTKTVIKEETVMKPHTEAYTVMKPVTVMKEFTEQRTVMKPEVIAKPVQEAYTVMKPVAESVMVMKPAVEERTVMKPEIEQHTVMKPVTETKKVLKEELETREVVQTKMVTRPVVTEKVVAPTMAGGSSKAEVKDVGMKVQSLGVVQGGIVSDEITGVRPGFAPTETIRTSTTQASPLGLGGNRILLCVTSAAPSLKGHQSGLWFSEVFEPFSIFTKADYECDICSLSGHFEMDSNSLSSSALDKDASAAWNDKKAPIHTSLSKLFKPTDINPANYAGIYFAGGHGAMWDFPSATPLQQLAAQIYERGGVVGAVCHGVAILSDLRLSNGQLLASGKQVCGFTTKSEESMGLLDEITHKYGLRTIQGMVQQTGAIWKEPTGDPMKEFVIDDQRLVTGVNPASAKRVAFKMLTYLERIAPIANLRAKEVVATETTITKERETVPLDSRASTRV